MSADWAIPKHEADKARIKMMVEAGFTAFSLRSMDRNDQLILASPAGVALLGTSYFVRQPVGNGGNASAFS
jgi:hypothetical protein